MANLLNVALGFLLIVSVALDLSPVNAQRRCTEILDPNNCVPDDCKNECIQKHNGNGLCVGSSGTGQFACACTYDCNLDESNSLN
ncbi:hypothetical protein RDI58_024939 [Solanum bulbocastanum]|uniref:Defensin-like protein n=1 Tax=Solanum bulbocastanum TaxID=147425 RepID=A0AAN8T6U4_SOLBU